MEAKEKRIKKVKRDIIISAVVLFLIEALIIFFVFYYKKWFMLWAPFLFLGIFLFSYYMDKNKIKLIKEEEETPVAEEEKES